MPRLNQRPVPAFLEGGGEAGALMRAFDWSATSVGPIETWPASLKTTIGTLLHSRHPMFLWWGPDLVQFYNDAYVPSFGKGKHPAALGQRGAECWQEIWPIIGPQIDDVMSRGIPSWNEDHLVPIVRNGRLEEVYWTYGYSPVFDDDGGIGGTLVVCTETTSRVLAERRVQSMRTCAERMSFAADSAALFDHAADAFSTAAGDVVFAMLYQIDAHATAPALTRTVGLSSEAAAALHRHFRSQLESCAADAPAHPMPDVVRVAGTPWPEPVSEVFVAPIAFAARAPIGYVLFGLSPRLPFDRAYRGYLRQLGEQVAQAQERIDVFRIRNVVESERNNLLEQAPVATALLTGPAHVFRLANPLFLQIVGRTNIVGKAYVEAFPELAGTAMPGILDRVYQTGEPFVTQEMHIPLERGGGGPVEDCFFRFNLEPMRSASGQVYGMMAVAVDITSQVSARKTLEKAQAERDSLVRELERASRAKDEFLAMLGHELRNPLSPILTALQLMRLRGVEGADNERAIIERQVKHVVRLVDDLLDVSRITRGKIELERNRVELADVVARAIEQASPLIEQRRHRLHVRVPEDLRVDGDSGRLAQVIANILTNAAKYTEPGGDIDVHAEQQDEEVWLRIRDTGIGVSAEMLPHVFDAFSQERQHSDRSQGGLGLGLAIVKSLVEAHGGSVALRSEGTGLGTECLVRLPVASDGASPVPEAPAAPSVAALNGCRVLLVDDNEDAAEMLGYCLRSLGHRVEVAFDAPAALDLSTRYVPDVALLDIGLPVIDGYELAARLRQQQGWSGVRFAAVTGYGQHNDRERTTAAGFDAHLVKPIDLSEVDATLRLLSGDELPDTTVR
jgi:signal transduction histidine kinase/ActR/RegA family two-component response regulator